jgi:hypothetical protein
MTIAPNIYCRLPNGTYSGISSAGEIPEGWVQVPTEEAKAWFAEYSKTRKAELRAKLDYTELRKRDYPPITDYIDGVVKGDDAQVQNYIAQCRAVKAKYPKPESK